MPAWVFSRGISAFGINTEISFTGLFVLFVLYPGQYWLGHIMSQFFLSSRAGFIVLDIKQIFYLFCISQQLHVCSCQDGQLTYAFFAAQA